MCGWGEGVGRLFVSGRGNSVLCGQGERVAVGRNAGDASQHTFPCVHWPRLSTELSCFKFQASLLKNDETKALTPASLQKELNNLLKFNPDFAEAVSLLSWKATTRLLFILKSHANEDWPIGPVSWKEMLLASQQASVAKRSLLPTCPCAVRGFFSPLSVAAPLHSSSFQGCELWTDDRWVFFFSSFGAKRFFPFFSFVTLFFFQIQIIPFLIGFLP